MPTKKQITFKFLFSALTPLFFSLLFWGTLLTSPLPLCGDTENSESSGNNKNEQHNEEIQTLKRNIENAAGENRYEEALRIIEEGKERFPDSPVFYEVSGELFMTKELYKIALNEYLEAQNLYLDSPALLPGEVILRIATLYGYLNKNEQSLSYFEKLLRFPDYTGEARQKLSWMYFKTSQLDEGISKIEKWLLEGFDPELAHSLGVLYSSKYDYDNSFSYYMAAIKYAEENDLKYFASIAYYNLSLLELSFYHFEKSYKYAEQSLRLFDRPTGYMGRANISILKMDLDATKKDLLSAKSTLEHPIPLLELTKLYLLFGAYQNASATLAEIELWEDSSWMYSYGYNKVSFAMTLSSLYSDYFSGLYYLEKTRICISLKEKFKRQSNLFKYKWQSFYHKVRKINYEKIHSKEDSQNGNIFDSDWTEYSRSEGYKRRSLKYLKKTEAFETQRIPLSRPHYAKERGTLLGDPKLIQASIDQLHPEWEKEVICEGYKELILLYKKNKNKSLEQKNLSLLYSVNPGGLRQYGILLPLALDFPQVTGNTGNNNKKRTLKSQKKIKKRISHLIKKTGTKIVSDNTPQFSLRFSWEKKNGGVLFYYFFDPTGDLILFGNEKLPDTDSVKTKDLATIVNKIFNRIYAPVSEGNPLY